MLFWVAIALGVPTSVGLLVALPFWFTRNNAVVGNMLAALVIFTAVLALIAREFIAIDQFRQHCLETGLGCRDLVSAEKAFIRYATYALIGLLDVAAIFTLHSILERKRERRHYAKEWR